MGKIEIKWDIPLINKIFLSVSAGTTWERMQFSGNQLFSQIPWF
jgi:hypothetical protein